MRPIWNGFCMEVDDMVNKILALALAGSLAGMLIFAAKWQEAKQAIWDERSIWLSEVKQLEHDKQILLEGSRHDAEALLWYADELMKTKACFEQCRNGNMVLQDKLSAILCPRNDHVWVDGVCVKCGRQKDAE